MSEFDRAQPFSFMRTVFKIGGIWTDEKSWSWCRIVYGCAVQFIFNLVFLITMCVNLAFLDNMNDAGDSLYVTLTKVSLFVKTINFVTKREKTLQFLEDVNSPLIVPRTPEEVKLVNESYKGFNRFRKISMALIWFFLSMQYCQTALSNGEKLPYLAWFPLDWRHNKTYYWILYTYQIIGMTLLATTNGSFDLMNGFLPLQISISYRLLAGRLKIIGYVRELDSREAKKDAALQLLSCIKMHQFVNRMMKCADDILTIPVFVQINFSAVVLCITAYQLAVAAAGAELQMFIVFVFFMTGMLIQIILPCYYGNEVIVASNALLTSAYLSNWAELGIPYRKFLCLFMENLKKPAVLKAGGYFSLSLQTLLAVIKGSYSLFALVINMMS